MKAVKDKYWLTIEFKKLIIQFDTIFWQPKWHLIFTTPGIQIDITDSSNTFILNLLLISIYIEYGKRC